MRYLVVCSLLLVCLAGGCGKTKKKPTAAHEKLVPTAQEQRTLEAYQIDPKSEFGQRKIRKLRERAEKLAAARERVQEWVEESRKRREEEAQ